MTNKTLHTKYGTARINKEGYYWITSRKEGNNGKRLHRLIAEDYFGDWINESLIDGEKIEIHHIDENPLNNCVLNLLPLPASEHRRLHHIDKNVSDNTKMKISESKNTSGYYGVSKYKDKRLNQGFTWRYQYMDNGGKKEIRSVDINKLEAKVKAKGLKWKKLEGGD